MKFSTSKLVLIAAAVALPGLVAGQQTADFGKSEYTDSCASCHGADARGNGPMRQHLVKAPSDLTTLTKRYGGAFPNQMVWEIVDGRLVDAIGPHGLREMPIWGARYRAQAMSEGAPAPEWYVRGKIVALLDYLARIQQK